MKLRNSTSWPDYFLRRMVSWCCAQVGLPVRRIRHGRFTWTRRHYKGLAWSSMRFLIRIGKTEDGYPLPAYHYKSGDVPALNDRMEALVAITAHELMHLTQWDEGVRRHRDRCEMGTCWAMKVAVEAFRVSREALLAQWNEAPSAALAAPPVALTEKRAVKAQADLARWQRKLKLAQTKVRKLKARVAYYQKARPTPGDEAGR